VTVSVLLIFYDEETAHERGRLLLYHLRIVMAHSCQYVPSRRGPTTGARHSPGGFPKPLSPNAITVEAVLPSLGSRAGRAPNAEIKIRNARPVPAMQRVHKTTLLWTWYREALEPSRAPFS